MSQCRRSNSWTMLKAPKQRRGRVRMSYREARSRRRPRGNGVPNPQTASRWWITGVPQPQTQCCCSTACCVLYFRMTWRSMASWCAAVSNEAPTLDKCAAASKGALALDWWPTPSAALDEAAALSDAVIVVSGRSAAEACTAIACSRKLMTSAIAVPEPRPAQCPIAPSRCENLTLPSSSPRAA